MNRTSIISLIDMFIEQDMISAKLKFMSIMYEYVEQNNYKIDTSKFQVNMYIMGSENLCLSIHYNKFMLMSNILCSVHEMTTSTIEKFIGDFLDTKHLLMRALSKLDTCKLLLESESKGHISTVGESLWIDQQMFIRKFEPCKFRYLAVLLLHTDNLVTLIDNTVKCINIQDVSSVLKINSMQFVIYKNCILNLSECRYVTPDEEKSALTKYRMQESMIL